MSIELRLSDVDPPLPDAPRTVYREVLNLPDPVKLGLTVRYFNFDGVGLYFQITGQASGYTFGTVDLGLLGSGANAYRNLDEFGERAKPSAGEFTEGEFDEDIKLILKAYTDAGYSDLKWTHERTVTVHWIKSDDPAWTVDVLNDFDDGTAQGWAKTDEEGYSTQVIANDYVLSVPYSYKLNNKSNTYSPADCRTRVYKSFDTPNKSVVFAIVNFRMSYYSGSDMRNKYVAVDRNTSRLVFLGRPYDAVKEDYLPKDKWMRTVVPLPKNTTLELGIIVSHLRASPGTANDFAYWWMDIFKIISK